MVYQRDEMTIRIAGVLMQVRRCSTLPVPGEITVVIPHAEVRRRFDKHGRVAEEELILDSITIVDSPRPEAEDRQLPGTHPAGYPSRRVPAGCPPGAVGAVGRFGAGSGQEGRGAPPSLPRATWSYHPGRRLELPDGENTEESTVES